MYAAMVVGDTSLVKPGLPTNRRPLRDRPTPAVTIRVHLDTYDWLKKLKKPDEHCDHPTRRPPDPYDWRRQLKKPDESFDPLIRLLLGRAVIVQKDPTAP